MVNPSAAPLAKRGRLAPAVSSPVGLLGNNLGPQAHADDALLRTREDQPASWRGSVSANNYVDLRTHDQLMSNPAAVRLRLLEKRTKPAPVSTARTALANTNTNTNTTPQEPLEDDLTFIRRTRSQCDRTASMPVRHVSRGQAPAPGPFFEPVRANYHPSVEAGSNEVLPLASTKPQPNGMTLHRTVGRDGFQRFASVPAHTYAASRSDLHDAELDVLGAQSDPNGSAGPTNDMDSVLARWAEEDEEGDFGSDDSSSSSDSDQEGLPTDAPTTAPYAHPVPSHPHPKMGKPIPGPGGATPWARRTFRTAQSAPVGALEFGRVRVNPDDLDADAPWRKVDFNKYFDADNVNF